MFNSDDRYQKKYLKYKNKYLKLKNKKGGSQLIANTLPDNLDCKIYMILIDENKKGIDLDELKSSLNVDSVEEFSSDYFSKLHNYPGLISFSFKPNLMNNSEIFKQIFVISDYNFSDLRLVKEVSKMGFQYGDDPNGSLTELETRIIDQFAKNNININWYLDPQGGERGCGTYIRLKGESDICIMFYYLIN